MSPTTHSDTYFQAALLERRDLLLRAGRSHSRPEITRLLAEVDAALARLDQGAYGICVRCHEHIDTDQLVNDPLAQYCREHPAAAEEDRLKRDLALAREVQRGLLPKPGGAIPGWSYGYRYEPAAEVGGDFFDVIPRGRDETLILVGDVSGKGVAASMLMSHLVAVFRTLAPLPIPTADLLARVNDLFRNSAASTSYATLAAASLHADRSVDLYSAGHWTPLVRHGRRTRRTEIAPGLPIGLFAESRYEPTRLSLAADDMLLFFTDGAIDAENDEGQDYSVDRLASALDVNDAPDVGGLINVVFDDVKRFQNGRPATDDLLLLGVKAA